MVTIEEEAIKLFEQGKKPEEVYEILSEKGIKASESTIETYNRLWRNGYKGQSAYLDDLAKRKGFGSWPEYRKHLLRKNGFKNYSEQSKYSKDPYFKEICDSNGSDGINNGYIIKDQDSKEICDSNGSDGINNGYIIKDQDSKEICDSNGSDGIKDNPYILESRILGMKAKSEDITETEEYEKLKEILENMKPKERLKYIGKLRRGIKILKERRSRDS